MTRRTPNSGGRRAPERMRAFILRGWARWTSPRTLSRNLTDWEILNMGVGDGSARTSNESRRTPD